MLEKLRRRVSRVIEGDPFCENVNGTTFIRHGLLLYVTRPFLDEATDFRHQNLQQVKVLARVLGELGYNVDVIDFNARRVRLPRAYDLVIDLHPGLNPVYWNHLAPAAKRIAYITGSNPSFANRAESERLEALYRRRGRRLRPRRHSRPFDKPLMESYDAMFFIGNAYTLRTYEEFRLKRVCLIRNTGYPELLNDDVTTKRPDTFLYLGSTGQVHKGLDRLLEVFARNPHLKLYVGGHFEAERDFFRLYRRELMETPNVVPLGYVDVSSARFRAVAAASGYVVMPSCSEGTAGGVLTAMSAGVVPIVSRECGFEDSEVHHLDSCSLGCLEETLNRFASKPLAWLQAECLRVQEVVRSKYLMEHYEASVRAGLQEVLGT